MLDKLPKKQIMSTTGQNSKDIGFISAKLAPISMASIPLSCQKPMSIWCHELYQNTFAFQSEQYLFEYLFIWERTDNLIGWVDPFNESNIQQSPKWPSVTSDFLLYIINEKFLVLILIIRHSKWKKNKQDLVLISSLVGKEWEEA